MKPLAATLLIVLLPLAGGAQTNDAQTLYQRGRDASTHGDLDKAVESFEQAVALKPNNADYRYRLAVAYGQAALAGGVLRMLSMGPKAKAELERAVQLDPDFIQARLTLLETYASAPAIAGGSESGAMEQALEIRKRDAIDGHRAFARLYTVAKKPELARKEYDDMMKEQPGSARAHYQFGLYLMLTEKNYGPAGDELEAAVKLDPSYMPAYFRIGHLAALASSNLARGEEALRKYLGYQPRDEEPAISRAHYWLGSIYEKQGRKTEAKSSYAESLKIKPNQKDVDEAIKRVS